MPLRLTRYLGYLAAIALVGVLTAVIGTLHTMFDSTLIEAIVSLPVSGGGLWIATMIMAHVVVYSLWGMISFRMLGRIGWRCRPPWPHVVIGWTFFAAIVWVAALIIVWGFATPMEALVLVGLVLVTLGFGLHSYGQHRAEMAETSREVVNEFA